MYCHLELLRRSFNVLKMLVAHHVLHPLCFDSHVPSLLLTFQDQCYYWLNHQGLNKPTPTPNSNSNSMCSSWRHHREIEYQEMESTDGGVHRLTHHADNNRLRKQPLFLTSSWGSPLSLSPPPLCTLKGWNHSDLGKQPGEASRKPHPAHTRTISDGIIFLCPQLLHCLTSSLI